VTTAHVALSPGTSGPASASFAPLDDESKPTAALASSLGDETKALDRVREHLAAGRPAQALGEIERYRARWPRGALAAEAALLRVDALLRSGNRSAAEAEANGLIARAPQSRYATRARALLNAGPAPRSSE
jgi:outer membrane protein assembly factor BamD (BamD/ComL family)